jgi:hypothetical protein
MGFSIPHTPTEPLAHTETWWPHPILRCSLTRLQSRISEWPMLLLPEKVQVLVCSCSGCGSWHLLIWVFALRVPTLTKSSRSRASARSPFYALQIEVTRHCLAFAHHKSRLCVPPSSRLPVRSKPARPRNLNNMIPRLMIRPKAVYRSQSENSKLQSQKGLH